MPTNYFPHSNWDANGDAVLAPDRAMRTALLPVFRDALVADGNLGESDALPTFIGTPISPERCCSCYGGVRAVVRVNTSTNSYANYCMRCAVAHFSNWADQQRQCRDCGYEFTGPISTWQHPGHTNVQGQSRNSGYPLCRSCTAEYTRCPSDMCRVYYRPDRSQPCHRPTIRCDYCSMQDSVPLGEETSFVRLDIVDRYNPTGPLAPSGLLCGVCVSDRITSCGGCGANSWRRDMATCGTDSTVLVCMRCTADPERWFVCHRHGTAVSAELGVEALCCNPFAQIHNYSYRPALQFRGDGPMFFGAEIEICTSDVDASANVAGRGFRGMVYLKEDGSVSSGFEMVTHPMTYEYWMSSFPWDTFGRLRESGAYEHRSCGIHVHAARDGFSGAAHEHRWLAFFDRNQQMIERIARRSNSSYARFGQLTARDKKMIATKEITPGEYRFQRYSAVNCNNAHTYEVRIFATSIDPDVIKGSIGFVSASIEYTRQLKARDVMKSAGMQWSAFREWVESRPEYAPLFAEMIRVGA